MLLITLAWRNVWRQTRRTIITLTTMALCITVAIPTFGLAEGITREMVNGVTKSHLGHIQIHDPRFPQQEDPAYSLDYDSVMMVLEKTPEVLSAAPRIYAGGMLSAKQGMKLSVGALPHRKKNICDISISPRISKAYDIGIGAVLYPKPALDGPCIAFSVTDIAPGAAEFMVFSELLPNFNTSSAPLEDESDVDTLLPLNAKQNLSHGKKSSGH
ncbi:hypothetical protein KKF84_08905, partial [Myxococcota bacterium]|nr:hypothetical protein [Myxococcota bacterium]